MYHGDISLGSTIDIKFTTRRFSTGAPFTLAGTPAISAYPDNSVTQITAGITLTADFDSVTGLNNVRVVATSGNGYAAGSNYTLVITTGTVDSVSVVGECIGSFSIEARSALRPTTAGRTLDVSAGGEAGLDWNNIGSPTTAQNLSGTTVKTATDVETDTADIQTKIGTPSDLGGGATVAANLADIEAQTDDIGVAGAGLTAINLPDQTMNITGNITGNLSGSVGSVTGNVGGNVTGNVGGDVQGNVDGSVASVTGAVGSVTGNVGGNVTGSVGSLAAQAKTDVNAEVLDVLNTDTFAEPGQEAPGATVTLVKKIGYLYKFLRNKITQDATTLKVFADDGTTVDQKATVSDDTTTYTRGEIGTGP